MNRNWTIGKQIGAGFTAIVALAIAIAATGVSSLRGVVESKDEVIRQYGEALVEAQRLLVAETSIVSSLRAYLIDGADEHLRLAKETENEMLTTLADLRRHLVLPELRQLIDEIDRKRTKYLAEAETVLRLKQENRPMDEVMREFSLKMMPARRALSGAIQVLVDRTERLRDDSTRESTDAATRAVTILLTTAGVMIAASALIAYMLTRGLGRQVGAAIQQVQSSAAELQAAANQQATAAAEQTTAMNEITTTINELLATSRQIADSAQRVSQIASQTAQSAGSGQVTMARADETFQSIRSQMDMIVNHMLDLGKKSQEIGAVLDIVSELAEQTNILAINATIEAAGAGESGKRFAIVADEIRKLADRVGGSTKEIRTLIDDVRSAVNTTVMATETGSKAVESGSKQFGDVTTSFTQITSLVETTTEASQEIELSTKQQTTAVEQVNLAVTNVSQTSRETEASSSQTLQTASQLAGLSNELLRMVQSNA